MHTLTPYSLSKNLGRAYNEAMRLLPNDGWAIIRDYDTLILTPETIAHIHKYIELNPNAGILTPLTNRIGKVSRSKQCYQKKVSNNSDIRHHINIAREVEKDLYKTTRLQAPISGLFMVLSKKTWLECPFPENSECLGVDTQFSKALQSQKKSILRMNGIYVFHSYRLENGIKDKTHLR